MSRQKARELLYSIELLKNRIPDLKLTLVGHVAKEFERELIEAVKKSGGQIEHQGRVPHEKALELMANADVCVCSIDSEIRDYQYSHPGKIFEYLAMGKVTIASDLEGIRGIIRHG
jgi:glycosyltransferase involved in cell wall biosynthesis